MSNTFAFNASAENQLTPEQELLQEAFLLWLDDQPALHFGALTSSLEAFLAQTGLLLPEPLQRAVESDPALQAFCTQALQLRTAHLSLTHHQMSHEIAELSPEAMATILEAKNQLADDQLEHLSGLYDDALTAREAFQAHALLESDPAAKQTYQAWQDLSEAFALNTQAVTVSMPDFSQHPDVQAAIEATVAECTPKRAGFNLFAFPAASRRWSAMAAAISLVVIAGGLFWRFSTPSLLSDEAIPSSESFMFAANVPVSPTETSSDAFVVTTF